MNVVAVESHSIDFVPLTERYGTPLRLFTIWLSINLSIVCAAVGTLGPAAGLSLSWTILGIAGAWLAGQAMRTLLFQVPATHIATFAAAAVTIGVVAMIACTLPALRAARTSPVEALADQ